MIAVNTNQKKNRKKAFRSVFQAIVIIALLYVAVNAIFNMHTYEDYDSKSITDKDNGFITLSYFGVDRTGDKTLISTNQLDEHLKALKNLGYVTITQQDVLDYYQAGKKLPEKSLFLIFEDGRRDTAIFSQKIMEEYNYKATVLSYADKFEKKDPKFLSISDLENLVDSTFWELGTNGYRLEYINAFDRYSNFLGQLNSLKYADVSPYIDRNYNHYLMDYIRDENDIPTETYDEMKNRIDYEYNKMQDIYEKELNKVPELYILMHSNTGQFGTNDKVSAVNEEDIKKLFKMNINREGYCLNNLESSQYDLTRLQPQPYWNTNHLLMRIWDDTKQNVKFVSGDVVRKFNWETPIGESEFIEDKIVLTSEPKGEGLMYLKDSESYKDFDLSAYITGNKAGIQKVYLRSDKERNKYLAVEINYNVLNIYEKVQGDEKLLFSLDLDKHDGIVPQSKDENKNEAEQEEIKTNLKYSPNVEQAKILASDLEEKTEENPATVADGAEEFEPSLEINESGSRYLQVFLKDDKLSVWIDNKAAVEDLKIEDVSEGLVLLESAWGGYGYSQRNLSDDVYDGIFEKLTITEPVENEAEKETIIYDNCLHGWDLFLNIAKEKWESIINWFVKNL